MMTTTIMTILFWVFLVLAVLAFPLVARECRENGKLSREKLTVLPGIFSVLGGFSAVLVPVCLLYPWSSMVQDAVLALFVGFLYIFCIIWASETAWEVGGSQAARPEVDK